MLTTRPDSVFALFGKAVRKKRDLLLEYRNLVQSVYGENLLAGLPTSTPAQQLDRNEIARATLALGMFESALSGEPPPERTSTVAVDVLQGLADDAALNVQELTTTEFRRRARELLPQLSVIYDSIGIDDIDDYVSSFSALRAGARSLSTAAEKVRELLVRDNVMLTDASIEDNSETAREILARAVVAKALLKWLTQAQVLEGSIVAGPYSDLLFPDDGLVLNSLSGTTLADVVVHTGVGGAPLTVSAGPASGDTTSIVVASDDLALELAGEVEEKTLTSGTCSGVPEQITSGTGAVPQAPYHAFPNTYWISDATAQFDSDGVLSGVLWLSTAGDTVANRWHEVDVVSSQTLLSVTSATYFVNGASIDYTIYQAATDILEDTSANFGDRLVGKMVSVGALGTARVVRVVSTTQLQLSSRLIPLSAVDGTAAATTSYAYTVYETGELSRELLVTDATYLYDYNIQTGSRVRISNSASRFESSVHSVPYAYEIILGSRVPAGSYDVLIENNVRPGDVLRLSSSGNEHVIQALRGANTLIVGPPVSSSLSGATAQIVPPAQSKVTQTLYDDLVDFEASGVLLGDVVEASIRGRVYKASVRALTAHALSLSRSLPVGESDIEYKILRGDELTTYRVTTGGSVASVVPGDVLAIAGLKPRDVYATSPVLLRPGVDVEETEVTYGTFARGGTAGYAHYAQVQDLLFGTAPLTIRSPDTLRGLLGYCVIDPGDVGSSVVTAASATLVGDGHDRSSRAQCSVLSLASVRFGDLVVLTTTRLSDSAVVDLYVYLDSWIDDDNVLNFWPAVDLSRYDSAVTAVDIRRAKSSNALYEAREIIRAVDDVLVVLDGFVPPSVPVADAFIRYLEQRRLDRAVDLLIRGDIETLASSSFKGLSYAGRMEELTSLVLDLIGDPT